MPKVTLNWEGKLVAGRYLVQKRLGEGGMGTVYLALDQQGNNTPVVLKTPRIALLEDPQFFKRFEREMRAMQQLRHPHLVPLFDLGEHNRIPFIVMKYLPGGSLRQRFRQGRARGLADLLPWLEPIAGALDYLHSQKVVHRDVKPDNVLFDERGVAYLTDLGAVKVQEGSGLSGKTKLTQTGFSLGTPGYMAPEVLFGKAYDGRADQYALAAMVYEALSGQVPYAADSIPALIEQLVRGGEAERLDRLCGVPVGVADAVARALARQPEQRYATCREFVQAVRVGFTAPPRAGGAMPTLVAPARARPGGPRVSPVPAAPVGVGANPGKAQPPSPGMPGAVVQPVAGTPPPHQLPPAPQGQPATPALAPTLPAEVMPPPVSPLLRRRGSSDWLSDWLRHFKRQPLAMQVAVLGLALLTGLVVLVGMALWALRPSQPLSPESRQAIEPAGPPTTSPGSPPPPTKPKGPAIWQVDFTNLHLAEAIRRAGPGDVIEIAAGRHTLRERITVDKPLTIRGAGRDQTHLLSWEELFAIQFTGTGPWTLEGLTIEHVGGATADVVVVDGGEITIRGCRFTGAVFDALKQPQGGCGAGVRGNARGLVSECMCDGNGLCGIEVSQQAEPALERNTCENNKGYGIAYLERAAGTARKNICRGNAVGIVVKDEAQPVLEGNTCENNKYSGIAYSVFFGGKPGGTARNNICQNNGHYGIFMDHATNAKLEANRLSGNPGGNVGRGVRVESSTVYLAEAIRKAEPGDTIEIPEGQHDLQERIVVDKSLKIRGAGREQTRLRSRYELFAIQFTGTGPWTLEGLTIEHVGPARANVVVVDGGEITIRCCRFTGGVYDEKAEQPRGGCGLVLRGNSRGRVIECICDANGAHGIELVDQAQPVLEGNTCQNNKQCGIAYFENAGGTARNNSCRGNLYHGLQVSEQAQPVLEGNTCENNRQDGIGYFGNARGTARNNTCRDNGIHGVGVNAQAQPVLEGNTCENNKQSGIAYQDNAGGTARNNTCRGNVYRGIDVSDQAQPILEANTCENNEASGIAYFENARGTARKNTCRGNGSYGIYIAKGANPKLEDNQLSGNKKGDLYREQ